MTTTTTNTAPRVPLRELVGRLGGVVDVHGYLPPGAVGPNLWGEDSVSAEDAAAVVAARTAGVAKHEAAVAAHRAYLDDLAAERRAHVEQAASKVGSRWPRVRIPAFVGPREAESVYNAARAERATADAAREARAEAGEAFDERHPPLELEAWLAGPGKQYR